MLKDLIRLANHLDQKGLTKEADHLDLVIRKMGQDYGVRPEAGQINPVDDRIRDYIKFTEALRYFTSEKFSSWNCDWDLREKFIDDWRYWLKSLYLPGAPKPEVVDGVVGTLDSKTEAHLDALIKKHNADGLVSKIHARIDAAIPDPGGYCDQMLKAQEEYIAFVNKKRGSDTTLGSYFDGSLGLSNMGGPSTQMMVEGLMEAKELGEPIPEMPEMDKFFDLEGKVYSALSRIFDGLPSLL